MFNFYESNIRQQFGNAEFIFLKSSERGVSTMTGMTLHSHFFYEVHFNTEKQCKMEFLTKEVCINTGEILIVKPNIMHYGLPYKNNRGVLQFVLNKIDGNHDFYEYFKKSLDSVSQIPLKVSGELISTIKSFIEDDFNNSIKDYCRGIIDSSRIIQLLFENINGFTQNKQLVSFKESENIFEIEFDELVNNTRMSTKEIAERLGYSVRHTARKIVETYGMTLSQIRRQSALRAAKKLIEVRHLPMEEVAYISGFKNSKALREAFKSQENTTPTKYRKSIKNKQ